MALAGLEPALQDYYDIFISSSKSHVIYSIIYYNDITIYTIRPIGRNPPIKYY